MYRYIFTVTVVVIDQVRSNVIDEMFRSLEVVNPIIGNLEDFNVDNDVKEW
jgi:hypothetical protein